MSQPDQDPFARRPHLDEVRARVEMMSLGRLTEIVMSAAEVVGGMDEADKRRGYAGEYLAYMLQRVGELHDEQTADAPTNLSGPYLHARQRMHESYGTGEGTDLQDPMGRDALFRELLGDEPDPEVVRRATAGMHAADAVLTQAIIGPPAPEQQ